MAALRLSGCPSAGTCLELGVNRVSESLESSWLWDTQLAVAQSGLECRTQAPNLGQLPLQPPQAIQEEVPPPPLAPSPVTGEIKRALNKEF